MFKSVFFKYFSVITLVICLSFLTLAAVQSAVSAKHWLNEKQELFTENACRVADNAALYFRPTPGNEERYSLFLDDHSSLPAIVELLSDALEADVMITDVRGVLLVRSFDRTAQGAPTFMQLPDDVVAEIGHSPSYFSVGTLNGVYDTRRYTAGAAIEQNGILLGYVVVTSPAGDMYAYLGQNLRIFLTSAVIALLLAAAAVYLFTYRMSMPLRKMAAAAKAFGEGDFSRRLPVKGKDEVAELAKELNAMAQSLSREEEMSRTFVANVSHELRTPMTTISGFVDGMRDGTIPPEKHDFYLSIVSDEVRRLSRLVQAMLNLSRIDNQSLKVCPSSFDLTALAGKTLLSFEQRIDEKKLCITGIEDAPDAPVVADEDLIGQVVYNLVDNAVKFTNEGGEIDIAILPSADRVTFSVRNTGDGIPADELPYVFDRFYKSDRSRSMDKTGAGLGLFLVKSIVGLHNGEISVSSVQGEYCRFEFWLPLRAADTENTKKV